MIERIRQIMSKKGMTPSQFADAIGIQRSGMSHILSGRNKPSLDFVMKVLNRFPDIDPTWLLKGDTIAKPKQDIKPRELTLFSDEENEFDKDETQNNERPKITKPSESKPISVKVDEPVSYSPTPKQRSEEVMGKNSPHRISKVILLYEDGFYEIMSNPQ